MSRWVALEGLIGAGKTTTATILADQLGFRMLFEHVEQHPLLATFYDDPNLFGLETELVFMALRLHAAKRELGSHPVISDFAPAKTLVFASQHLADEDVALLSMLDDRLWRDHPPPDFTVFLDVPPATCLKRIRGRGRPFEQDVPLDYLESLREAYLARLESFGARVERFELEGGESRQDVAGRLATRLGELGWTPAQPA